MIVRYSVENYKSFKEQQVFSMIAGQTTKHKDHIINVNDKRLLKGSYFFGANASGKSNLIESIQFARSIIMNGASRARLINKHFRIDPEYRNKPGVFQFDILANSHFYSYGLSISYEKAIIEEEWLYLCDKSEIVIFERSGDEPVSTGLSFSNEDEETRFRLISEDVPDHKTLLMEVSERKLIDRADFIAFKDVWQWFSDMIIIKPNSKYAHRSSFFNEENGSLISSFDTGIDSIKQRKDPIDDILGGLSQSKRAEIIEQLEEEFSVDNSSGKAPESLIISQKGSQYEITMEDGKLMAMHILSDHGNSDDLFETSDESDGTQRLFDLIPIYAKAQTPSVILVDELDRSFHTKLVWKFIELFYKKSEGSASQLIASLHDINVMDLTLLRRDEIWFVERQGDHSSRIFSLNKFHDRYDKVVSKDYLLGRYGAIPCLDQLDELEGGES